ncbi:MAG: hypothetical protein LBS14_03260 [Holosporaceae bacterium]|jgi:hypothetical protein|nr:hypothetical protein [Holosporaceae bacterium]
MKLLFDWSTSFYENKNNWRDDEEIISLEIFQKECGFAIAKVTVSARKKSNGDMQKYAKIGVQSQEGGEIELLFSGRLVSFPIGFGRSTTELEFISEPDDYQTKLAEFSYKNSERCQRINRHELYAENILFDDLFFSARDAKNPTIFLEGKNEVFCWNMKNGNLSLSDIHRGRNNFDLDGSDVLQDSIRVRLAREPYKVINLRLSANWIQYDYGIIDLVPMISARFTQRVINSFTNIKSGIEKIFSTKNGYHLISRDIREINSSGLGLECPAVSPDFYVQENEGAERKKVLFKRFYFSGKLIIGWAYRQKRVEFANVTILNRSSPHGREKNLCLKLNAIQLPKKYPIWNHFTYYGDSEKVQYGDSIFECACAHVSGENFEFSRWKFAQKIPGALLNDTSSSFFATQRGKNAIKYAMQKAIALVNYSSRHVEIDFSVDASKFIFASVDDQVTIRDDRFPNGRIVGKIIRTRFIGSADRKIMKFTIGCRTADLSRSFDKLNSYEIRVDDDESRVNPGDIVQKIQVENPPEEQIEVMSRMVAHSGAELEQILRKCVTKIKLFLHPLNTARLISREIMLPDFEMMRERMDHKSEDGGAEELRS